MSRESKIFSTSKTLIQEKIKHYESFGWELLSINNGDVSMTRETQNPVYSDLVKYEFEYEQLYKQLEETRSQIKYKTFDFSKFIKLFILLIFPSVIYVCDLIKNQKKNKELNAKANELISKINNICSMSRSVFFGKQSN